MSEFTRIIIAVAIILLCIGIFIFSYLINKKTPKPDGCENIGEACDGCQVLMCSHNKANASNEEDKK